MHIQQRIYTSAMIDRNIGTAERFVRFALAVLLIGWVFFSNSFGVAQVLALIAAFALLWNSIFGRCYLWKWLGLSSCEGRCATEGPDCRS
mgnify:CR=1 FL=1